MIPSCSTFLEFNLLWFLIGIGVPWVLTGLGFTAFSTLIVFSKSGDILAIRWSTSVTRSSWSFAVMVRKINSSPDLGSVSGSQAKLSLEFRNSATGVLQFTFREFPLVASVSIWGCSTFMFSDAFFWMSWKKNDSQQELTFPIRRWKRIVNGNNYFIIIHLIYLLMSLMSEWRKIIDENE